VVDDVGVGDVGVGDVGVDKDVDVLGENVDVLMKMLLMKTLVCC
jgi:hypothetical protein